MSNIKDQQNLSEVFHFRTTADEAETIRKAVPAGSPVSQWLRSVTVAAAEKGGKHGS